MVKGISRQVIVVQSPDPKLFEQAIFILKDEAVAQGVTEEALMKQARAAIRGPARQGRGGASRLRGGLWALGGALVTAFFWLITALL